MMEFDELEAYVKRSRMQNAWQVERDYLQHMVLDAIYSGSMTADRLAMVFKGGTSLQKRRVVDRFSIDLDFTSNLDEAQLNRLLEHVKGYLNGIGIASYFSTEHKRRSTTVRIKLMGPKYVQSRSEHAMVTVRLEISRRESVAVEPDIVRIEPPYKDVLPYTVSAMNLNEVAAEKVSAILTRDEPRDVYDLSILLGKGYRIHEFLVSKKLEWYGIKFDLDEFLGAVAAKREAWKTEIGNLLYGGGATESAMPEFDSVNGAIGDYMKKYVSISIAFNLGGKFVTVNGGRVFSPEKITALGDFDGALGKEGFVTNTSFSVTACAFKDVGGVVVEFGGGNANPIDVPLDLMILPRTTESIPVGISMQKGDRLTMRLFVQKPVEVNEITVGVILENA